MNRTLAALSFGAFFCSAAVAQADEDWVGLYQALDPADGSVNFMSVAPKMGGGYELTAIVPSHGKCGGAPAVVTASAQIESGRLVREQTFLACEGAEKESHSDATYTLDDDNELIVLKAPFDGRTLYYHRISE